MDRPCSLGQELQGIQVTLTAGDDSFLLRSEWRQMVPDLFGRGGMAAKAVLSTIPPAGCAAACVARTTVVGPNESTSSFCVRVGVAPYTGRLGVCTPVHMSFLTFEVCESRSRALMSSRGLITPHKAKITVGKSQVSVWATAGQGHRYVHT